MTDKEIWQQLAGVMGMIQESEEWQAALARNIHERMQMIERRLDLLESRDGAALTPGDLIDEHRRLLGRLESRHELRGAVLAELKSMISQLDELLE